LWPVGDWRASARRSPPPGTAPGFALVQDRSRLGGNSSSEVKMHVVGANCHKGRPGWREGGLIGEFRLEDAARNPQRCFELWDLMLYDKMFSEPNTTLLLETTLYSARKKGGRIESVMARCDKSETLYRIRAKLFCDSTGDSRLALEAGAKMRTAAKRAPSSTKRSHPRRPITRRSEVASSSPRAIMVSPCGLRRPCGRER
jgi:hypothetical protein